MRHGRSRARYSAGCEAPVMPLQHSLTQGCETIVLQTPLPTLAWVLTQVAGFLSSFRPNLMFATIKGEVGGRVEQHGQRVSKAVRGSALVHCVTVPRPLHAGAGHMAPQTNPREAYVLMSRFLNSQL